MALEIQFFFSPEIINLLTWKPKAGEEVYYLLQIDIGIEGEEVSDTFQLMVLDPPSLERHFLELKESDEKTIVIQGEYRWDKVQQMLEEILDECWKGNWLASLGELRKRFWWEYEDCQVVDGGEDFNIRLN